MRSELVGVALIWVTLCLPASAEPAGKPSVVRDPVAAEALFEEGRRAIARNDVPNACAKFAESQRLDPGAGTLMNWASCEERRGHVATAWQRWREAIDALAPHDDRVAFAKKHAAALEPRLPRLNISLTERAPSSTRVLRDDVVLGPASLGTPLPVDPGLRRITVRATGFEPRTFAIQIAEGERKDIEVGPGKALPPPPQEKSGASTQSGQRSVGWALLALGGVGVITGITTGLMLPAKQDEVDANCSADGCNQSGLDAASEGKTLLVLNAVGWGAGIAGLASGAFLVLSSKNRPAASDTVARRSSGVAMVTLPSGLGFGYRSRF